MLWAATNIFTAFTKRCCSQNLPFEEVYDIIAFRIILDTIPQCYEALGLMHSLWRPIAKKFKDYIGMPKPNMYQSLHTTVIGPFGERIEIQIRTVKWTGWPNPALPPIGATKREKRSDEECLQKPLPGFRIWWKTRKHIKDPGRISGKRAHRSVSRRSLRVHPPRGHQVAPQRRDAGGFCLFDPLRSRGPVRRGQGQRPHGTRLNMSFKPVKSSRSVTSKGHHPSKDWLNFVKTVKARSRIRQWIKTQEKERSISLGREMCEKAFRKFRLNFNTMLKSEEMEKVVESFGFKQTEDLIASVGYGKITPLQIIRKITPREEIDNTESASSTKSSPKLRKKGKKAGWWSRGWTISWCVLANAASRCPVTPLPAISRVVTG